MKHVSTRCAIEDQNKKVTLTQQLLPVVSKAGLGAIKISFKKSVDFFRAINRLISSRTTNNLNSKIQSLLYITTNEMTYK